MVDHGPSPRMKIRLPDDILAISSQVWAKYGHCNNSEIKSIVYRTDPMRFILRAEAAGRKMTNKPVLYKDKAAGP